MTLSLVGQDPKFLGILRSQVVSQMTTMTEEEIRDKLSYLLNTKYKELREQNHIEESVLTYNVKEGTIKAVPLLELPLRYPIEGTTARWSGRDLGRLIARKALLYRQSKIAHEISDENPESQPTCGTVVLIIPPDGLFNWVSVRANITPECTG